MPRTGTFGGFAFDPEVFAEYMAEQPTWSNAIIASGILQEDATIMDLIGSRGNVATLPFYKAMDIADYEDYISLRRFGSVPHSGFGIGFDRLVMYVTGVSNIRDVLLYPRTPKELK